MGRVAGCAVLLLLALFSATARAAGDEVPWLVADDQTPGWLGLYLLWDFPGSQVRFYEDVGGRLVPLARTVVPDDGGFTAHVPKVTPWRCGRPLRKFVAKVRRLDGTRVTRRYSIRTQSCAARLDVSVPAWAPRGTVVPVEVSDRWRLGAIAPEVCVRPPSGRSRCGALRLRGARTSTRRVRVGRAGHWTVSVRFAGSVERHVLRSGGRRRGTSTLPTLLVSGDSTPQGVDGALSELLRGRAFVVRAWRGGTSLSHDEEWHWSTVAPQQARMYKPRVTLLSMGANEGWPMPALDGSGDVKCCDAPWRAAYRVRLERMIDAYARVGHVLWMLLPTPENPARQRIEDTINAIAMSVAATRSDITLVHLEQALSPDGRFHRSIRWKGRTRVVRQYDGIHLTPAGARIAAELVVRTLDADPSLLGP